MSLSNVVPLSSVIGGTFRPLNTVPLGPASAPSVTGALFVSPLTSGSFAGDAGASGASRAAFKAASRAKLAGGRAGASFRIGGAAKTEAAKDKAIRGEIKSDRMVEGGAQALWAGVGGRARKVRDSEIDLSAQLSVDATGRTPVSRRNRVCGKRATGKCDSNEMQVRASKLQSQ